MTTPTEQQKCDNRLQHEAEKQAQYWRALADAELCHCLDLVPAAEDVAE